LKIAGGVAVTITYDEGWLGRPVIVGSINGVRGRFLIDTGANEPVLTMKAIRECRIALSRGARLAASLGDDRPKQLRYVEGNVTVELDGASITWGSPSVAAGLGSDDWFGVIDYRTLKASKAVINLQEKTITLSP
jgi:hypothetical protein